MKQKITWVFDDELSTNPKTATESDPSPIKLDDYDFN